jgi:hypothetical protein
MTLRPEELTTYHALHLLKKIRDSGLLSLAVWGDDLDIIAAVLSPTPVVLQPRPAVTQSDATLQRIRSTTPRHRLSIIIRTSDTCIDTRVGDPIRAVLDPDREILESISLPHELPDSQ